MLTTERLKQLLNYNPETGGWTWISSPTRKPQLLDKEAGHLAASDGCRRIMIDRVMYRASRLAWFYMKNEWPKEEIDHEDRDPSNDCWNNLREASSADNKCNTNLSSRNTSGFRGVSWLASRNKWRAEISGLHLGLYDSIEEAVAARDSVAIKLHGKFASLNTTEGVTL